MSERFRVALADAAMGDIVELGGTYALVTALLDGDRVELAPLVRAPGSGEPKRMGLPTTIVTTASRKIDPLGDPVDRGPALRDTERTPIFSRLPHLTTPSHARGRLTMGALVHDLARSISLGASLLAIGRREQLFHVMQHQHHEGRDVIVAAPSRKVTPADNAQLREVERYEAMMRVYDLAHTRVTVDERHSETAAWLVPWSAMAIASALRARGRDVVVVFDDLDAWRFPCRAMPERGTFATQLAQLSSHAYASAKGSVSLIAYTKNPRPSPIVCDAFDTALELDRHARGDFGTSYTKYIRPPIKVEERRSLLRAQISTTELDELSMYSALDASSRARLVHGRRLREVSRYWPGCPIDSLEQMLATIAVEQIEMPVERVIPFVEEYLAILRRDHSDKLSAVRTAKKLDTASDAAFLAIAKTIKV